MADWGAQGSAGQGAAGSFSLTAGPVGGNTLPDTSLKKSGEERAVPEEAILGEP
jgi:hypothetical protein